MVFLSTSAFAVLESVPHSHATEHMLFPFPLLVVTSPIPIIIVTYVTQRETSWAPKTPHPSSNSLNPLLLLAQFT